MQVPSVQQPGDQTALHAAGTDGIRGAWRSPEPQANANLPAGPVALEARGPGPRPSRTACPGLPRVRRDGRRTERRDNVSL